MSDNIVKIRKLSQTAADIQPDLAVVPEFNDVNESLRSFRQRSWETYKSSPMPTEKDEDWRRTSLKGLNFTNLALQPLSVTTSTQFPRELLDGLADQEHGGQVMVSPSKVETHLDEKLRAQGVIFEDIQTAAKLHPQLLEKVLSRVDHQKHGKFSALAGSLTANGVILYIPKMVVVASPLQSLYWAPGSGLVHSSQVFVYLEEGSSVTFVHESSSPANEPGTTLHAGLMEIYVGTGASLKFVELQSWGENVWNITRENVDVDRDGSIDWIFGALGSKLTKNYSDLNLIGRGSTGKISGFFFTDKKQHLDHDTQQNHLAPNTTSDLLFKGALTDESRSVWQGMIYVAPNASKTDGYQANRNLILSKKARADSIPGLEILTDDVRCTHGATVGKIDKDQIFYLESRGLPIETAERLIVEGFFDPIMQRIPFEGVKARFQKAIKEKMEHIGRINQTNMI